MTCVAQLKGRTGNLFGMWINLAKAQNKQQPIVGAP